MATYRDLIEEVRKGVSSVGDLAITLVADVDSVSAAVDALQKAKIVARTVGVTESYERLTLRTEAREESDVERLAAVAGLKLQTELEDSAD